MKPFQSILIALIVAVIGAIIADFLYLSKFIPRFKAIEKQRIVTSNKLATAKIVSENLDHVRELVFKNMDFPGQKDSVSQESIIFEFLTNCINDLKMRLVSVKPSRPTSDGRVTKYGYDIQLEGDFFSLGEFCAKLENSQRVLALTSFEIERNREGSSAGPSKPGAGPSKKEISIKLHLETYRLRKS